MYLGNCAAMKGYYPELDFSRFIRVNADCEKERWFFQRYKTGGGSLPFIVIAKPDDANTVTLIALIVPLITLITLSTLIYLRCCISITGMWTRPQVSKHSPLHKVA